MKEENYFTFGGKGVVFSYTKLSDPNSVPQGFEFNVPYYLALIKLDEGPMITAQLTDLGQDEPYIDMPVEMTTRKLRADGDINTGVIIYGYKFRPPIKCGSI